MDTLTRGNGNICDVVAECLVSGDIVGPTSSDFPRLEDLFQIGSSTGGDWLWEISHIPGDPGPGEFNLWVGDDTGTELKEWEKIVQVDEFIPHLLTAISHYSSENPERAENMRNVISVLKKNLWELR